MLAKQQVHMLEHFLKRARAGEFEAIAVVAVNRKGKIDLVSTASGLFISALYMGVCELADGLKREAFQQRDGRPARHRQPRA
jgi:hypothetical protein